MKIIEQHNFPKYVKIEKWNQFRLIDVFEDHEGVFARYWRDGGKYGIHAYFNEEGKLISSSNFKLVHNKELFETTEEEWRKSNGDYIKDLNI